MLRAVLDTNVLVSSIISDGKARELLKKAIANQYRIVTSELILRELATVLNRPKFKTRPDEVIGIIDTLRRTADVVDVKTKIKVVREDSKDDMIIETALDGGAPIIVTGDSHLLGLGNFKEIKILTIKEMLTLLKETST